MFDKQRFIYNLSIMTRYGWEPEIDIECKDGKTRGIVAYGDWLDIYDENHNIIKRIKNIKELFEVIPAETIVSAVDVLGLDYSEDLSDRMLIHDGKLYLG